jgi:hypothetical protein
MNGHLICYVNIFIGCNYYSNVGHFQNINFAEVMTEKHKILKRRILRKKKNSLQRIKSHKEYNL